METKPDIRTFDTQRLSAWFAEQGEKTFRRKQVESWLWQQGARSFDEMSNLPLALRTRLGETFSFGTLSLADQQRSQDRTIKSAFRMPDGNVVEGVLIPTTSRMTACISSQVGCSLTCKFCATGRLPRLRNLEAWEIFEQVWLIRQQSETNYNLPLSNIVYMGMGEPLLNYRNVMTSIDWITRPEGLGMSPQRITVSTAGIAKMIARLGDDGARFNLALSLHAANDEKRNHIMPINEQNSLDSLADAIRYFYEKTGTRVTYEYIVFRDFNDGISDAAELVSFCRKTTAKVNIIEYNPIDAGEFQQTTPARLDAFKQHLEQNGIITNVRRSRGKDIDAACGQLANKNEAAKSAR